MKFVALVLVLIVALCAASPVPWNNCGKSSDVLQVKVLDITPFPPRKGSDIALHVIGNLTSELVAGGNYKLSVYWNGIELKKMKGDFCTLSKDFTCPHPAGMVNITKSFNIPGWAPSGSYSLALSATTADNREIVCGSATISLNLADEIDMPKESTPVAAPTKEKRTLVSLLNKDLSKELINGPISMIKLAQLEETAKTWTAGRNPGLNGHTLSSLTRLVSRVKPTKPKRNKKLQSGFVYDPRVMTGAEASFDARQEWPKCFGYPANQGQCAAGWAISTASTISNRACIKNSSFVDYSALDILSNNEDNDGCMGGDPQIALQYVADQGITTSHCLPYLKPAGPIDPCDVEGKPCVSTDDPESQITPAPVTQCVNSTSSYEESKLRISKDIETPETVGAIAEAIAKKGPVIASMELYDDLFYYTGGIYTNQEGNFLGYHTVKLVGYGSENGQDYWIAENTWGLKWGEFGAFRIPRGTNECAIEDFVIAPLFD